MKTFIITYERRVLKPHQPHRSNTMYLRGNGSFYASYLWYDFGRCIWVDEAEFFGTVLKRVYRFFL